LQAGFATHGFADVPGVLSAAECAAILRELPRGTSEAVGSRLLLRHGWCRRLADALLQNSLIASMVPRDDVAVQCTYFEKSVDRNWLVPMRQDLSIPVAARVDHPALSGWSEKEGELFVQPPEFVLAQLVALRLHLDPCGVDDGALSVVPGSHSLGRMLPAAALRERERRGAVLCPATQGGVLAMRPLLLHASSRATGQSQRRVLHFSFGPRELPFGLAWG
jgi:hypothetical protein